ncbi:hypothetical protein N9N67_04520 [Bacteriovoracaceae bacterium]|nr:hypothetical protein [Bacteriovoracaceae bacterium]
MSLKYYLRVIFLFCLSNLAFSNNAMKTYYVIGDLHGNFKAMKLAYSYTEVINLDSIQINHFDCFNNNYYSQESQKCMNDLVDLVQVNFDENKLIETYIYQMGDLFDKGQFDIELLLISEAILKKVAQQNFQNLHVKFFIGNHEYLRSTISNEVYRQSLIDVYGRRFGTQMVTSRARHLTPLKKSEKPPLFDTLNFLKISPINNMNKGGYASLLNNPYYRPTILQSDRIIFSHGGISDHFIQSNISEPEDADDTFEEINSKIADWFTTHSFAGEDKHYHETILNNKPLHKAGPLFYRVRDNKQIYSESNKDQKKRHNLENPNHSCEVMHGDKTKITPGSMYDKLKLKLNTDFLIVGHTSRDPNDEFDGKIRGKCFYRSLRPFKENPFRIPLVYITDTGINGKTTGKELERRSQILKIDICSNDVKKFSILPSSPYKGTKFSNLASSPYEGQEEYFGFAKDPSCPDK